MRVALIVAAVAVVIGACKKDDKPAGGKQDPGAPAKAPTPDAEPPPPVVPAPPLGAVEGQPTVAKGQAIFADSCVSCHGADAKGQGRAAEALAFPPTDLTTTNYLCRSTTGGPPPVPSDTDVEGAIDRGTHRSDEQTRSLVAGFTGEQRRSLTMYLKSLARSFAGDAQPLAPIAPETADDAGSKERGRMLYLGWGCWRCHGAAGKGDGEPAALKSIMWNSRNFPMSDLADQDAYLCGADPATIYRTITLGRGGAGAVIMPAYGSMAEMTWKNEQSPDQWGKALDGKIPAEELAAWRVYWASLPTEEEVRAMKPADRRARAGNLTWDLVHYLRSL